MVESDEESAPHRSTAIGIETPREHLQAKLLGGEKGEEK